MSPLWVLALAITLVGAIVVFGALRRTRDELGPTVEAFAGLRDALRPLAGGEDREPSSGVGIR